MTCDTANRPKTVSAGPSPIVEDATYEPGGQVSTLALGNGRSSSFAYDGRSRLTATTSSGVVGLAYGYDGDDNVVSLCRDVGDAACAASPTPSALTRRMTYDRAGRLLTAVAPGQWGTLAYDYDALGNRTLKSGATSTVFGYGEDNRLVSAEGPEVFTPMTLTWSLAGNLASSSDGVTYRYDGAGRRVVKSTATQTVLYHYDAAGRVLAETLADGSRLRDYVYFGSRLIAVEGCISSDAPPCNEREWYHGDGLGSTVARTGGDGGVTARLDYQPWGEQWTVAGAQGDRQYNGRVYDPGTGFHDYGARMYWPQIGRFVTADSYRGEIARPTTLNRYAYVVNNPFGYVDPTGHEIVITGSDGFKRAMETTLLIVRGTETGREMFTQLAQSKHVFTFKEGDYASFRATDETNARKSGVGSEGWIKFNFKERFAFKDENGDTQVAPFAQVLAHEMKHAVDSEEGHLDHGPDHANPKQTRAQRDAIAAENRVRRELGLLHERTNSWESPD